MLEEETSLALLFLDSALSAGAADLLANGVITIVNNNISGYTDRIGGVRSYINDY